ncbi:hypothetical protein ACFQD2_08470 [Pseudomonas lini]
MLFYVQQVNKEKGSNFHQVVLDFATSSDHVSFARLLNDRAALDGSVQESSSSMIRFSYEPNGYSSFREGSWYEIDPKAFDSAEYVPVEMNAAGGLFLGAELNNVPWTKVSHAKKLAPPQVATVSTVPIQFLTDPDPTGIITLTVVNCGHANWNEIETPSDRIIYDVGASRLSPKLRSEPSLIAARSALKNGLYVYSSVTGMLTITWLCLNSRPSNLPNYAMW